MKKPEAAYREHLLGSSIPDKIELLKRKTESGYPMDLFYKSGNGMKTLLQETGRLTDFKGVFIVTGLSKNLLVLGESTHVISEIQKLSRAQRVKDKNILEKIGREYGTKSAAGSQQLLNQSEVNWLEIADKTERTILKRALRSMVLFTL